MGGKGSGGARAGAGRKPKDRALKIVHGTASIAERLAAAAGLEDEAAPAAPAGQVEAPADLTVEERAVWDELAPMAIEARTLAASSARAFALLCRAVALEREYLRIVQAEGYTVFTPAGPKAHPMVAQHRAMLQRVEAAMVRFKLSPIGKELEAAAPAKPISKLAMLRGGA